MSYHNSRRGFVKGIAGVALVLGFDPRSRSWVTELRAGEPCDGLPPLDGTVQTEGLEPFAADFGRIVSRRPRAVLIPGSVNDIVKIVRFARCHHLKVAVNGQAGTDDMRESHSNFGQSQVQAGITIDIKPLSSVAVGDRSAEVGAGAHWRSVYDAAEARGLTPPVLNDYMHLSVGGTLSVGGIGGTSLHFGLQGDSTSALEVVTGAGELVRCSPEENRALFDAVLAGGGQCGIVVRAWLRLVPAETQAMVFLLYYDDLRTYVEDQSVLLREGRFSYLQGQVVRRPDDSGWRFFIEAVSYFTPPNTPDQAALLAGLRDNRAEAQISVQSFREWNFRLDPVVAFLKSIGVWQLPHPWLTLFLPESVTVDYVGRVLSNLTLADTGQGPILFYPVDTARVRRPLYRLPDERRAFHLSILRTGSPDPVVTTGMLNQNRTFYDAAVAIGGTRYIIGAIPGFSQEDWRRHFGPVWDFLERSKRRFDPDNVLTPGQGMFPG